MSKFFEEIGLNPERDLRFPVLYHYTSTSVALKILESQKFWATAHDCTNDKRGIGISERHRLRLC